MKTRLTKLEVYNKAVKFFEKGEYEKAEDLYNKILENLADIGYDITLIQKVPQDWDN